MGFRLGFYTPNTYGILYKKNRFGYIHVLEFCKDLQYIKEDIELRWDTLMRTTSNQIR